MKGEENQTRKKVKKVMKTEKNGRDVIGGFSRKYQRSRKREWRLSGRGKCSNGGVIEPDVVTVMITWK